MEKKEPVGDELRKTIAPLIPPDPPKPRAGIILTMPAADATFRVHN
jgi:hypothetical protein